MTRSSAIAAQMLSPADREAISSAICLQAKRYWARGADRITDYEIGVDKFNFSQFDTNPGIAGIQGFAFVASAAFSGGGAAQIRYTSSGADMLVQADVDGDGFADMEIMLQGLGGGALTSGDFIL